MPRPIAEVDSISSSCDRERRGQAWAWWRGLCGGSARATMRGSTRGRSTARPTTQYLAARTRNAAGDALDEAPDVSGVVCVPESPPMLGQLPLWSRGAGVPGAGVAGVVGVVGSACAGTVVEGVSCAEALNGFRTVSANDALAMPNAVMPVVTTFLIRCTLSLVVDSHRHHAPRHIRQA